jgi:hypothetical protein
MISPPFSIFALLRAVFRIIQKLEKTSFALEFFYINRNMIYRQGKEIGNLAVPKAPLSVEAKDSLI